MAISFAGGSGGTMSIAPRLNKGFSWVAAVKVNVQKGKRQTLFEIGGAGPNTLEFFIDDAGALTLDAAGAVIKLEPADKILFDGKLVMLGAHYKRDRDVTVVEIQINDGKTFVAKKRTKKIPGGTVLALGNNTAKSSGAYMDVEEIVAAGFLSKKDRKQMHQYIADRWFKQTMH